MDWMKGAAIPGHRKRWGFVRTVLRVTPLNSNMGSRPGVLPNHQIGLTIQKCEF